MQIPSIPELEILAVQIAVFILLLLALAGLIVEEWHRLLRKLRSVRQPSAAAASQSQTAQG